MIEIDFGKLILLALVALIVLGPEKLPGAARTAGALLRRLRSGWDNVRAEVERELEIEEIRRAAREAAAHAEAAQVELDSALRQVRDPLAQAAAKTSERFQLTDAAPAGDSSASVTERVSLSDRGGMHDALEAQSEHENSLGGAERGEPVALGHDSGFAVSDAPMTGQLFADAPVPTGRAPATIKPEDAPVPAPNKSSAHGGH